MNVQELTKQLQKLHSFSQPDASLEQYSTPPAIAADFLLRHQDIIADKHVFDLGCGPGMLGIAALHLGASHVSFLDIDTHALDDLKTNLSSFSPDRYTIIHSPIKAIQADTVITNPPFGTKHRHADKHFLLAAFNSASDILSMHLAGNESFLDETANTHHFKRKQSYLVEWPLTNTMPQHTKHQATIQVLLVYFQQQRL